VSLGDLIKSPLRRLSPYLGMFINVDTWVAAHGYHSTQQRLHTLSMHRPGIVVGLEAVAWNPPDNSVVISPGLAVDSEGDTIIVSDSQRLTIPTQEQGTVYLILRYREVPQDATRETSGEAEEPSYLIEGFTLEIRRDLPSDPYLELGRIQMVNLDGRITDAAIQHRPAPDEIDLRYRKISGPHPLGEVNIGIVPLEVGADGAIRHMEGAVALVRALNATYGYYAELRGTVTLNQEITDYNVILMTGQQGFNLDTACYPFLTNFLDRGGILLGEACGEGVAAGERPTAFQKSFTDLAEALQRRLAIVERGNPLLQAHHMFGQLPDGIDGPPQVVAGDGIIYSTGDYGCLWAGGRKDTPTPREAIRSATELGVNLGIQASQRAHIRSVQLIAH